MRSHRMQIQKKREAHHIADEKEHRGEGLSPSFSRPQTDSDAEHHLRPMDNPRLQLQRTQAYGFQLNQRSQCHRGMGDRLANKSSSLSIADARQPIQSKSIDRNTWGLTNRETQVSPLSNSNKPRAPRSIQAKPDNNIVIQQKPSVQQSLSCIKAGRHFEPIKTWKISDFVTYDNSNNRFIILNQKKFEIFSIFLENESGAENSNCIWLLSSINWRSARQLLGVAELIAENSFIPRGHYKYQKYVPRLKYPTPSLPENINASGSKSKKLKQAYEELEQLKDRKGNDPERVTAILKLSYAVYAVGRAAFDFLSSNMLEFSSQTYQTIFPDTYTAASIIEGLDQVPGGARKRQLLKKYRGSKAEETSLDDARTFRGYQEPEDSQTNSSR